MPSQLIHPLRSEVVLREDIIEDENDPRPNAYFDQNTNVIRVYHGLLYGNATGRLNSLTASIPTETNSSQIHANAHGARNVSVPVDHTGAPIPGPKLTAMLSDGVKAMKGPAMAIILDGMVVNGAPYHGPPFAVAVVPPELVGLVLGAAGKTNTEENTENAAHKDAKGKGNEYRNTSGQNDINNSGAGPKTPIFAREEQSNSLERELKRLNDNMAAARHDWGARDSNNSRYVPVARQDGPPTSGRDLNLGGASFRDPAPTLPHQPLSANPWASQPSSANPFDRANPPSPWGRKTVDHDAAWQFNQDLAAIKANLIAAGGASPLTPGSPVIRPTQYYVDKLDALLEKVRQDEESVKRMAEAREKAEEKEKAETERKRAAKERERNDPAPHPFANMDIDEILREVGRGTAAREAEERAAHLRSHTANNISIGSWADGFGPILPKETVDRRTRVDGDNGNDIFGDDEPVIPWSVPVEKATWGFPDAAANMRDWKKGGNGGSQDQSW